MLKCTETFRNIKDKIERLWGSNSPLVFGHSANILQEKLYKIKMVTIINHNFVAMMKTLTINGTVLNRKLAKRSFEKFHYSHDKYYAC